MANYNYHIHDFFKLNNQFILIQLKQEISPSNLQAILHIKSKIEKLFPAAYVYFTYAEIGVRFPYFEDINEKLEQLKEVFLSTEEEALNLSLTSKTIEVPVCYSPEIAPDLGYFLKHKKLSLEELIELHTSPQYLVYFIGFLPGFLYLGGLNKKLFFPRKNTPSPTIEAGSVGIGYEQTGIYPQDSPGGWHIIGKTPQQLFDASATNPVAFQAGNKLKFKSISLDEYESLTTKNS